MYVFSLTMFNGSTHSESCFCIEPDGPYLWNVHLVILGNINTIGSTRSSWCSVDMLNTRRPYVMNSPSKNRFIQYICSRTLVRHMNSHVQYLAAYQVCCCKGENTLYEKDAKEIWYKNTSLADERRGEKCALVQRTPGFFFF